MLDAVVSDAAEHLAELNVQKELADAGTHLKGGCWRSARNCHLKKRAISGSGHVGESDITVEDFVENCRQFEDRLCEKYGVRKAWRQLQYLQKTSHGLFWFLPSDLGWCQTPH